MCLKIKGNTDICITLPAVSVADALQIGYLSYYKLHAAATDLYYIIEHSSDIYFFAFESTSVKDNL